MATRTDAHRTNHRVGAALHGELGGRAELAMWLENTGTWWDRESLIVRRAEAACRHSGSCRR